MTNIRPKTPPARFAQPAPLARRSPRSAHESDVPTTARTIPTTTAAPTCSRPRWRRAPESCPRARQEARRPPASRAGSLGRRTRSRPAPAGRGRAAGACAARSRSAFPPRERWGQRHDVLDARMPSVVTEVDAAAERDNQVVHRPRTAAPSRERRHLAMDTGSSAGPAQRTRGQTPNAAALLGRDSDRGVLRRAGGEQLPRPGEHRAVRRPGEERAVETRRTPSSASCGPDGAAGSASTFTGASTASTTRRSGRDP